MSVIISEIIKTARANKTMLVFIVFSQDLSERFADFFIMTSFPVYFAAAFTARKIVKIVIYIIRDKLLYFNLTSYFRKFSITLKALTRHH